MLVRRGAVPAPYSVLLVKSQSSESGQMSFVLVINFMVGLGSLLWDFQPVFRVVCSFGIKEKATQNFADNSSSV